MFGQIQRKPYRRFDLDLSIARTAQQFFEVGSFIWVEECDGVVEIKLNDNQAAFFKLIDGSFYKVSEYKQFWIKNTAQAGKSLKALIGDADFFRSVRRGVYDHAKLSNVTANQHHTPTVAGDLNLNDLAEKLHASLASVTANQHHNETHAHTVKTTLSFAVVGTLTTGNDKAPTIVAPHTLTIVKAKIVVKTAPTGASLIVDVNKNGTTIFTTQANRPEIAISGTTDDSGTPDVTALAETDKITIDIDQVGSTVAGADLTVELVCTQAI